MAFRFAFAAVILALAALLILMIMPDNVLTVGVFSIVLGLSSILAFCGFVFNLKGIREPITAMKLFSLAANGILGLGFLLLLVFYYLQEVAYATAHNISLLQ